MMERDCTSPRAMMPKPPRLDGDVINRCLAFWESPRADEMITRTAVSKSSRNTLGMIIVRVRWRSFDDTHSLAICMKDW